MTRVSEFEWQWQEADKICGVRLFAATRKLIWSKWTDTAAGPQFEPGVAQQFEQFITNGAPEGWHPAPQLIEEIRAKLTMLTKATKRRLPRFFK
jgi:hypothetical protein